MKNIKVKEYIKTAVYVLLTLSALILSGIHGSSFGKNNPDSISIKVTTTIPPILSGFAAKLHEKQ